MTSLWRNRKFTAFVAVQTFSSAGDSFSYVAIPLLVLHTTGSVVQMGLLTALSGAAALLTGLFAGVVADRMNRRLLLVICDIARLILYGSIPVVWAFGPQLWLLYVVVPLASCFGMIFQVTHVTVVPSLVGKDQITRANGLLYASYAVAYMAGPALAGAISGALGPANAIAVDAASFAVSALGIFLVPIPAHDKQDEGTWHRFIGGAKFLWRHPVLRPLTVLLAVFTSITTGLTDVFIFRLKNDLGQPDRVVGYVMATGIVGTLLASLLVPKIKQRFGFGFTWTSASVLCGLMVVLMAFTSAPVWVALVAAAVLFATGVAGIASMSLRQEVTPPELLGRVTSAFWTLHGVLNPFGIALLAAAAGSYGTSATLMVAGVAAVLTASAALLTPIIRTSGRFVVS